MREKLQQNQWWLLALLGCAAVGGGWFLTKNTLAALGAAVLAYFIVSLKKAAAWPSFFLLLCSSGLGVLITHNLGIGGKTGSVGGAIGGFLGGFVLLALLYAIKKRAGEETPTRPTETGAPAGEPIRVQTTLGGPQGLDINTLAQMAEGNFLTQALESLLTLGASEGELGRARTKMLNLLGVPSDEQIQAAEEQQRAARQPRRRRFPWIRLGQNSIPKS